MTLTDKLNLTAEQKTNTILELIEQTIEHLHNLGLINASQKKDLQEKADKSRLRQFKSTKR